MVLVAKYLLIGRRFSDDNTNEKKRKLSHAINEQSEMPLGHMMVIVW